MQDAVFNDPNLGTCASNPGTSGLACFCTSDITGYDLTDATIALCARNHFRMLSTTFHTLYQDTAI